MKNFFSLIVVLVLGLLLVSGCRWLDKGLEDDTPLPKDEQRSTEQIEKEKRELNEKNRKLEERIEKLERAEKQERQPKKTPSQNYPQQDQDDQTETNQKQRRANSPADGWLALRSQPNSSSRLITKIPHGSPVIQQYCTTRVRSGKLYGRWCRVRYRNMTGWAFDYYLR